MRRSALLGAAAVAIALALPSAASAHAYLIRTSPAASVVLNNAPATVSLTFDEAVEPRFAIISVTSPSGAQQTTAPVHRSPANPDTLVVPLAPHLPEGWYLIYWRAISIDGHPVQGAFTYAVGPNPGPAPQFRVPSVSATAVTAGLLISRTVMFLAVTIAIGLLALRLVIARPLIRRLPGSSLRALSFAFVISSVVGLLAIPIYLDVAVANDSLRSVFDLGAVVPLFRATAFGRAVLDMELCFALFSIAGWAALWLDRPDRDRRSLAELGATLGAITGAIATLIIPGVAGHAGQTSPRGLSLLVDFVHLLSGAVWLGGLVGLLVLWLTSAQRTRALAIVVPRFSNIALVSVLVLLLTGTIATIDHMPAINALWDTGYGVAILVKLAILLAAAAIGAVNLTRTTPGLQSNPGRWRLPAHWTPDRSAAILRRTVSGETLLVGGAVFVAALLSSLAPPPPSFALQNSAVARVGPGPVAQSVARAGYRLQVLVSPNKAAAPDSFALRITKNGQPVRGATVTLAFNHLEMQMPQQEYSLRESAPGVYSRAAPALVMVGKWGLSFQVSPPGGPSFTALIVDQANG